MSHYTVGIITKEKPNYTQLEDMLEPYSENLRVAPYITRSYEEVKKELVEYLERVVKSYEENEEVDKEKIKEYNKLAQALKEDNIEYIRNWNEENNYYYGIDEKGNALSTYNPNSKWDWWDIGGRWSGMIDNNQQKLTELKPLINKGQYTEEELIAMYPEHYEYYMDMLNGKSYYRKEYILSQYPDLETYVMKMENLYTYALMLPNGEWIEPGEMGWFGISAASEEEHRDYEENYWKIVEEMAKRYPDGYMTIVDCHI